ncbi:DNA primase [Curtobacterium sp. Csp2]|uniref:DNA primase n=1 Tax=Curtobacterium sp. Csp2 TaxID=2495430 RepID=UPI0015807A81|nr:DNA primase [Curtobacterium sp. Csp2]QKS15695.1 DNA primase [Curtobacterium sp. Csp2]
MRECIWCGRSIVAKNRQARFCSSKCRVYAHRNPIPKAMTAAERWVRRSATKVPLTVTGSAASSTNPDTWSSYQDATASSAGVGLGFMLGDGFACIDLDHCLIDGVPNGAAARFLEQFPGSHVEISPSGDGLHIWGTAGERPGKIRAEHDGLHVERYSRERYITVTGNAYRHGQLLPL